MTFATVSDLIDALREHQLLEPSQLDEVARDLVPRYDDPSALVSLLVQWGWLTQFQADQLFQGRAAELTVGPYRVLEPLGMGGMGQVYKALQQRLNRVVALKVIRQDRLSRDPEAVKRFQRESRAAAQLSHPNVVIVYDADQVGDRHYIAMEYVEGTDLARLIKEQGPLPVGIACDFIRQAALGLQHAFEQGMVHRDIKPSNLLVTVPKAARGISGLIPRPILPARPAEQPAKAVAAPPKTPPWLLPGAIVKILDMGLARIIEPAENASASSTSSLTQLGTVVGTPDFIAPEQARDARAADIRSDLYSLGCTLYYLLSGQPPFPEGSVMEKLLMHQLDHPQPLEELREEVPVPVLGIVRRLMEKRPDDRYQAPIELANALAALPAPGAAEPTPRASASGVVSTRPPSTAIVKVKPLAQETAPASSETSAPARAPAEREPAAPSGDSPTRIASFKGHRGWVTAVTFTADRNTLASGGVEGTVRLWSFTKDRPSNQVLSQAHLREVHSLAFAPDGRTLAVGSGTLDGLVWLWELTGEGTREKGVLQGHKAPVDALAFSPDGRLLASAGYDKTVRLWDMNGGQPRERATLKGHTDSIRALVFDPEGKTAASCGQDGTVRLWDVGRTWCRERATLAGHMGPVHALAFAKDGQTLVSGGLDQTVRLWSMGDKPKEQLVFKGHPGAVQLVLFVPDGSGIMSVGDSGRVVLWEVAAGAKAREWVLPRGMLCSAAFTHDGRYLATGNSDGTVYVYRMYPKRADA